MMGIHKDTNKGYSKNYKKANYKNRDNRSHKNYKDHKSNESYTSYYNHHPPDLASERLDPDSGRDRIYVRGKTYYK